MSAESEAIWRNCGDQHCATLAGVVFSDGEVRCIRHATDYLQLKILTDPKIMCHAYRGEEAEAEVTH